MLKEGSSWIVRAKEICAITWASVRALNRYIPQTRCKILLFAIFSRVSHVSIGTMRRTVINQTSFQKIGNLYLLLVNNPVLSIPLLGVVCMTGLNGGPKKT
jgi:hypothetical protein